MAETEYPHKRKWQSIFLQRETGLIVLALVVLLAVTTALFFVLWTYFKIAFIWLIAFIGMFATRKTDAWKMGVEVFFLLTFIFAYSLGWPFAYSVFIPMLLLVVKIRPDEGSGAVVHTITLSGIVVTARILFSIFGIPPTQEEFTLLAISTIAVWQFIDYFVTLKIAPVHWTKTLVTHIFAVFINYFWINLFGYKLFQFILSLT